MQAQSENNVMRRIWIAMLAACIFVGAPPAQAWEDDEPESRVEDGDHRVCLKKGFKSGSARYAKCREALAPRANQRPARAQRLVGALCDALPSTGLRTKHSRF
jgi:hypothetical protein